MQLALQFSDKIHKPKLEGNSFISNGNIFYFFSLQFGYFILKAVNKKNNNNNNTISPLGGVGGFEIHLQILLL